MKHLTKTGLGIMKARELIGSPDDWCKEFARVERNGRTLFCMGGALAAIFVPSLAMSDAEQALNRVTRAEGFEDYVDFNDDPDTTHQDVMDFMLKAAFIAT